MISLALPLLSLNPTIYGCNSKSLELPHRYLGNLVLKVRIAPNLCLERPNAYAIFTDYESVNLWQESLSFLPKTLSIRHGKNYFFEWMFQRGQNDTSDQAPTVTAGALSTYRFRSIQRWDANEDAGAKQSSWNTRIKRLKRRTCQERRRASYFDTIWRIWRTSPQEHETLD